MTLVWKTRAGSLLQTQVGTVDVLNIFSAASSIYGWMGGTDGLRLLLERILNPFGKRLKELKLDRNLHLMPSQGHVLTSLGPLVAHINDAQGSFGGDIRTQVIGTTLCALAHECEVLQAVRLFCRFLLPYLFGAPSPLLGVLQSQLMENATSRKIINEGASRGLNNLFIDVAAKLNLSVANSGWGPVGQGKREYGYKFYGPVPMISGLLTWITKEGASEYRTRSSAVARVAAYLKAIGYNIGNITSWNGVGEAPVLMSPNSVLLVLGGSSQTDLYLTEDELVSDRPLLLHYQHETTGAMLLTALGHVSDISHIPPETLQEDFEQTLEHIESHLTVQYTCRDDGIYAVHHWREVDKKASPLAIRLASIYFSHTAEYVAPCYYRVQTQKYLNCVKGKSKKVMQSDETKLARFRAVTACVAIAIVSRFAPGTFKTTHHATRLCLCSPQWLTTVCNVLDLDDAFPIPTIVTLLASVHAGIYEAHRREDIPAVGTDTVAWREGIYSVIPSLLLDMKLSPQNFQFVCLDHFWANVKTEENGSIKSSNTFDVQRHEIDTDLPSNLDGSSTVDRLAEPYLGPPNVSTPDCPLYLSLGTPLHYGDPHLGFIGWFQGSVAGTVGIMDVLKVLLMSQGEPELCPGHDKGPMQVVNIRPSTWVREPHSKPINREHPVFVQVAGDHCWAIFVAGQMARQNGRIVFRCPTCADENYGSQVTDILASASKPQRCFVGFCDNSMSI
ncbi:MAG: hypothetical protein Q9213_000340 [Squamulea squamosa]